ncbi:MAG TPA: carbohydrate ABC transporter permease [Gaiellaceae bacterium]|nr:carbohydrate ABC transporter permease [Gaiellaceae bacterium]
MNLRSTRKLGWNVVGIAVFVVMAFPVFWMISTALKSNDQINSLSPTWFPLHPTVSHFSDAIHKQYFVSDLVNTLIVVLIAVGIAMVLAFLAAVALAKYRFRGRKLFVLLIIGVQMIPGIGLIIPLYVMLAHVPVLGLNLVGQLSGVIVVYVSAVLPFSVWTLRGFLLGIPKELEEAAMVDGSTRIGAFIRILLPLVAPGLVATSVFAFITSWNEFIFANLLLQRQGNQTITVWLASFTGGSTFVDWGGLMAASTLIAIPVVIFFLIVQRRIAFGLTVGAVKG